MLRILETEAVLIFLKLELLSVTVSQQDVSLRGGEALELLGRHHVSPQGGQLRLDLSLPFHGLSVLLEVELERLDVVFEAES